MILVEDLKLLGKGTQKTVYEHPNDSDKVIKVMHPEHSTADGGISGQYQLRAHRSQGIYRQFRREVLQYPQLCKNSYSQQRFTFPVETFYGFIATDRGIGLITEKVVSPTGSPLTLEQLFTDNNLKEKHAKALNRFFDECCELHVVFGEVNIAGIMYTEQRRGFPEFVLVDGIGEKLLIPFRAMSKTINSHNIRKTERKTKILIKF